jgi:predicted GTPase
MARSLRKRAESATKEVQEILGVSAENQPKEVTEAIEHAITTVLLEERKRCAEVASKCWEDDRDRAEKVESEINRINSALIANLSSMR